MSRLKLVFNNDMSEREVIEPGGFESLLSPLMDRLWTFSLKLTRSEPEAEDLFQDSILKAYRAFGSLRDLKRFKPWIFQILYREWVSRKRVEARRHFVDFPCDETVAVSPSPWDLFSWGQVTGKLASEIQSEVDALACEFREVIWLRYVEDLDYQEIARILNISEGTVASRLHRAKGILKEKLWHYAEQNGWVEAHESKE